VLSIGILAAAVGLAWMLALHPAGVLLRRVDARREGYSITDDDRVVRVAEAAPVRGGHRGSQPGARGGLALPGG
jgi:hypothetical protein